MFLAAIAPQIINRLHAVARFRDNPQPRRPPHGCSQQKTVIGRIIRHEHRNYFLGLFVHDCSNNSRTKAVITANLARDVRERK